MILLLAPASDPNDPYQSSACVKQQVRIEAQRLREERVIDKDLEGVVVILDAGHGGRDQGASIPRLGLLEDEINYDIVCRIKQILETHSRARVYTTVYDLEQENMPTNATCFTHDTSEVLLTTPNYTNDDAKVSANLRWYLANDIYFQERDQGVDERKIVFASIHCDALANDSLQAAMVYVPGAKYRRESEQPSGNIYSRFEEVKGNPISSSSASQHKIDESLSYNFATTLLHSMRTNDPPITVHDVGDPIRNVIRQSGGRAYVPAVLRNNLVPTKVLIQLANMTNHSDQKNLADPEWRQFFAVAFVNGLRDHFNDSPPRTVLAPSMQADN